MSDTDADAALKLIEDTLADLDKITKPDSIAYRDSVRVKLRDMQSWIEERDHVTPSMLAAIENMARGVQAWLPP
jgi:hypothetical protein